MRGAPGGASINRGETTMKLLSGPGLLGLWEWLTSHLRGAGEVVPRLAMRLVMGW